MFVVGLVGEIRGWWEVVEVIVSLGGLLVGLFSAMDRGGLALLEGQSTTHAVLTPIASDRAKEGDKQSRMLDNQGKMADNQGKMLTNQEEMLDKRRWSSSSSGSPTRWTNACPTVDRAPGSDRGAFIRGEPSGPRAE